jgi:hypothetical protein
VIWLVILLAFILVAIIGAMLARRQ